MLCLVLAAASRCCAEPADEAVVVRAVVGVGVLCLVLAAAGRCYTDETAVVVGAVVGVGVLCLVLAVASRCCAEPADDVVVVP